MFCNSPFLFYILRLLWLDLNSSLALPAFRGNKYLWDGEWGEFKKGEVFVE